MVRLNASVSVRASGLLFLHGRLHFHRPIAPNPARCASRPHEYVEYGPDSYACQHCGRAERNAGAPSVLCAYGQNDLDRLAASNLSGALVPLRFARFTVIAGLDLSWAQLVQEWLQRQGGSVCVSDAYRFFARHPKAGNNPNWRAKVRQKLAQVGERMARDCYRPRQESIA